MTDPRQTATHNEQPFAKIGAQLDATAVDLVAKRGKLTQKALYIEAHDKHIERLDKLIAQQETELVQLRPISIEHAKYQTSNRFTTIAFLVCAPAVLIGTCLISQCAAGQNSSDHSWNAVGWALVIIGSAIELFLGLFRPLAH
jgi:hypothetical protein